MDQAARQLELGALFRAGDAPPGAPFRHRFTYRVFSLFADLDELDKIGERLPGFSHNRWNILSLWDRDLGPRDGTAPRPWIARQLATAGLPSDGPVRVLCFPRVLGYVFNPITLWFCYDSEQRLIAVLYEVSNTFGQHHAYLLPVEPGDERVDHAFDKHFYVSPFIEMTADYRIKVKAPGERVALRPFTSPGRASRKMVPPDSTPGIPASERNWVGAAFCRRRCRRNPLLTWKVIGAHPLASAAALAERGAHAPSPPRPAARSLVTLGSQRQLRTSPCRPYDKERCASP